MQYLNDLLVAVQLVRLYATGHVSDNTLQINGDQVCLTSSVMHKHLKCCKLLVAYKLNK